MSAGSADRKNSQSKTTGLKETFDKMSYKEQLNNTSSVMKWLEKTKGAFSTTVNGKSYHDDDDEGETFQSKVDSLEILVKVLKTEEGVISASKKALDGATAAASDMSTAAHDENVKKLHNLLKTKEAELIQLEGLATRSPAWAIRENEWASWFSSKEQSASKQLVKVLQSGDAQVFLEPTLPTYSMRALLDVLEAGVGTEHKLIIYVSITKDTVAFALPIMFAVEALNDTKIRQTPVSVVLMSPDVVQTSLLEKLAKEGIKKRVLIDSLACQDCPIFKDSDNNVEFAVSGAINLSAKNGKGVHYVVDTSADLVSAAAFISRNTWVKGSSMNQACRTLLYAQQSVVTKLIENLTQKVEDLKVVGQLSDIKTRSDFIEKNECAEVANSVAALGAKVIGSKVDFTVPTILYNIGTSSSIVAAKGPGLGHILVIIPYRSKAELITLSNNQEDPSEIFLFCNSAPGITDLVNGFSGQKIVVNGDRLAAPNVLERSWVVVASAKNTPSLDSVVGSSVVNISKAPQACKDWAVGSWEKQVANLMQLVRLAKGPEQVVAQLLAKYLESTLKSSLCVPNKDFNKLSGIIVADASEIEVGSLITAIAACVLRIQPVILVSLQSDFPKAVVEAVNKSFPPGIITIVNKASWESVKSAAQGWELVWIFQGRQHNIPVNWTSSSTTKTLLITGASDTDVWYNADIAISSVIKNCYF